jgi:hypothetical protein
MRAQQRFREVAGNVRPTGRLSVENLALVEDADVRRAVMDQHAVVDSILDGTYVRAGSATVSDYVWFDEQDIAVDPLRSRRTVHEGVFRLTSLSDAFLEAIDWRLGSIDTEDADACEEHTDWLRKLAEEHPKNPYLFARLINFIGSGPYMEGVDFTTSTAHELWPSAVQCRQAFDSVIPSEFRGTISHNLVGNGAKNREYFGLLYFGALCAKQLGLRKEALAWARRSVKFCKHDSLGAFVLLAHLQGKPDPRLTFIAGRSTKSSNASLGLPKFKAP